jgi:hypothetical protein
MLIEHDPEVHNVQNVNAQVAKIVAHCLSEVLRRRGGEPGSVIAVHCADLGHDCEVAWIESKRLADQLIDDMGAMEIAGVIYAAGDRFAQNGDRRLVIARRSDYAGPRHLRRAEAHSMNRAAPYDEAASGLDFRH